MLGLDIVWFNLLDSQEGVLTGYYSMKIQDVMWKKRPLLECNKTLSLFLFWFNVKLKANNLPCLFVLYNNREWQ